MFLKISWDEDFDTLMMHLWAKYGRKIFTENGLGDQLDLNKFSKEFFTNRGTTADISIDGNANVQSQQPLKPAPVHRQAEKVGRNDPCSCGSGKKYKKCCGK